ncbi:MAG: efflux transporter outer membrane subunit [Proteobacteria bacterium]|nr:efflux transporter outer membrane subunit [Pseudomonadota bacterium]
MTVTGILALAGQLAGCAAGPDFHAPAPVATSTYTPAPQPAQTAGSVGAGGAAQHFVAADSPSAQWWQAFGSPLLDHLVQEALEDSPTVAQARLKLRQAQEDYRSESGALLWPQLDASLRASRQKPDPAAAGLGSLVAGRSFPPFTLYSGKVNVSYNFDLFGASRRTLEGLAAAVDYQRYELEAARLTLAGNVVTTALRRASLARQIALTESLLTDQASQLQITTERVRAGGVSQMELLSERAQVEATRASLPPLRAALAQADHSLAVYRGRPPAEPASAQADPGALDLDALSLPTDLPLTLPSKLAQQRPDIRASEALLHQASANVGVATANLYPQITLSGSTGPEGLSLSHMLNIWSASAAITQPIFHGGALRAHRRSAEAAYEAALAGYRQTVLGGLQQVADALRALQEDALELQARDAAQRSTHASAGIAAERYAAGGLSQLALLDAQGQELRTALDRTRAQAQRLTDTAALYQALGARP